MIKNKGHFQEGNEHRYIAAGDKPLTAHIGLKLNEDDKAALKQIPGWSEKLRAAVKQIIKEHGE